MIRRDEEKREPLQFRFGSDIAKFPRVTMVASHRQLLLPDSPPPNILYIHHRPLPVQAEFVLVRYRPSSFQRHSLGAVSVKKRILSPIQLIDLDLWKD